MKNLIKLLIVGLLGVLLIACGKTSSKKVSTVYVGTNAEFAPFEFQKNGEVTGFDIDLINAIAKSANINIKIKDMTFDGLLPALQSKKVDLIIAGLTATNERKKAISFSNSYYKATQVIVTRKDSKDISAFKELSHKKVGVMLGFTGDVVVSKIENVDKKQFNAAYSAILDLKNNKIDAVVLDSEPAYNFVKNNEGLKVASAKIDSENYAIGVYKGNKELLEKVNKGLKTVKENGEYDKLIKKWFN